jgi:hypothetical protein
MIPGVRYFDGSTLVSLGDHVEVRGLILFFLRKKGRVVYVPGISKHNPEMEFNGLSWVGVDFDDGTFSGTLVDPKTGCLQEIVKFLERDKAPDRELQPEDTLDD